MKLDHFLILHTKAKETKAELDYWNYTKIKSFCTMEETINKITRQLTEWGEIFANGISQFLNLSSIDILGWVILG